MSLMFYLRFFFSCYGDHPDLHVLTHSFPTRRSSDLLKADLSVEADTVYSDTQGQSATVFAFTHLLGINLMPRIRNWRDLVMCRPDRGASYKHINRSEEHTSELQSLMRISYAVFCLKTKKYNTNVTQNTHTDTL